MYFSPAHCINGEEWLFAGLSLTEAKKLSSYFHFTEPVNLKNKTLLEKADLDPSTDFLDSLEHDVPQGKDFLFFSLYQEIQWKGRLSA